MWIDETHTSVNVCFRNGTSMSIDDRFRVINDYLRGISLTDETRPHLFGLMRTIGLILRGEEEIISSDEAVQVRK